MQFEYDKTYIYTIMNVTFSDFPAEELNELFRDGRISSHFMERDLGKRFNLKHVPGCKDHDLVGLDLKIDEKTFTRGGCKFMPSNMIGTGRSFNKEEFIKKSSNLVYAIVSVVDFPEIKTRFVKGDKLAEKYPTGEISFNKHAYFFTDFPKPN